jgi:hypothetical protein
MGTTILIGQQYLWNEQRIKLKISYHNSVYQQYNPSVLGSNLAERMLKDYNGHTFWFSFNLHSLTTLKVFPKFVNLAFGYGADGMLNGYGNPSQVNGVPVPYFKEHKQYYISPDIDLSKINVKSKTLKKIFSVLDIIKVPMPALEYNTLGNLKFHWLYF